MGHGKQDPRTTLQGLIGDITVILVWAELLLEMTEGQARDITSRIVARANKAAMNARQIQLGGELSAISSEADAPAPRPD